ncbi:MAG: GNAT family N-acetyltransferase [Chlamydiae bacterium RIFCSPHIGHO2_12_FULL_44_59]|nr:MAG: GNAT family N-acetyltransferase [Chlamydiae bacterium RIFCSPHIGHO2_01_FULL_44_39]OGN59753.1 MAG: GNAT family N-acetyltransferase [Chlamydiae bacterium RIFCSPHIGHO2_12_FULL_44_59]OGN65842.1 MAG: GNAT family N-acetyltransferase [Chlamydiae bacterium RIFCSPLOWO2_01_FULL_44_52]OGN68013.1 MAG: GNAT family N-acetyltransferase [Chlamydiae bacterium RIFCSPLOWO2_02_FULL_45_22]OGN69441.1 MAG: GNAT family N-acetyltransferase [Chlamydiae bacterium RIFCSPLOWO2_12_FULL_45_20]
MRFLMTVRTKRLILRPWQESDLEPFAQLNADPRVREYFPGILSREESDASVKLMSNHIEKCGWGFWAASLIETGEFIGMIGLEDVYFKAHFTPAVEIGWRLAFDYWGKGYATEGAQAALQYGFESLNLNEIVSFTTLENMRSRHVMKKIGMHHDPKDDFDHPKLPEGHPLRRHMLYRLNKTDWKMEQQAWK